MEYTAKIVDFKKEKAARKPKAKGQDHKMDFSKFRSILNSTKKE